MTRKNSQTGRILNGGKKQPRQCDIVNILGNTNTTEKKTNCIEGETVEKSAKECGVASE